MAKVSTVNVAVIGADVGYGLFTLSALLRANGWTIVSAGDGTGRGVTALTQGQWIAAGGTWEVLNRGLVWVSIQRVGINSMTVRFAVTTPLANGTGTVMDAQSVIANQVQYLNIFVSGASRAHAITSDSDENAAGVRSFYLLFSDGTSTLRGTIALEAMADGTYATANPAPYAVSAANSAINFSVQSNTWSWWYSPTSAWTALTSLSAPGSAGFMAGVASPAGVNPWSSEDQAVPATWYRQVSSPTPGLLGQSATLRVACVPRGYPDTVNLATDAYLYVGNGASGSSLIPWPNAVVPL